VTAAVPIRRAGASANGIPCSLDAERFVLGSILLDDQAFAGALADLKPEHFSLEAHRRILRRASDLYGREERVNAVTLHEELARHEEAESVGGLSYLISLDEGLPRIPNIDSYIRILQEHATRRRIMFTCQHLMDRAAIGTEDLAGIIQAGQELFTTTTAGQACSIEDLPSIAECGAVDIEYIRRPELPRGAVVGLTGDAGSGKSTLLTAWARDAWRNQGVPALFLDRENSLNVVAERLQRLGVEDGPGLRFWGGWLPAEAPQPYCSTVRAWAAERKGLVVVDSLSAFLEGDQNDAAIVRRFMHQARRLANAGATVVLVHHSGKSESAQDYRGSSDFKAAIDQGFHVANYGTDGRLEKLVLRAYKSRIGVSGELSYQYAGGRFVRGDIQEARQTVSEQLTALLRLNPGVTARRFDELTNARGLGRNKARVFLADGVLAGSIRRETGPGKTKRYCLAVSHE
jgi:KaiC/GvpD/RAD55 family RecA-like ATPase